MIQFDNLHPISSPIRVLVCGAHPDDPELGCGGFLRLLAAFGANITLCIFSDGSRGGAATIRQREARAAAELLSAECICFGLPDTRVRLNPAIAALEKVVADFCPQLVLVHSPQDTHQDHRVATRATLSSVRHVPNLLYYEGPSSRNFSPQAYLDIEHVMKDKLELIRCHQSQTSRKNLEDWALRTGIYRGLRAGSNCQFAEAFRVVRQTLTVATFACLPVPKRSSDAASMLRDIKSQVQHRPEGFVEEDLAGSVSGSAPPAGSWAGTA